MHTWLKSWFVFILLMSVGVFWGLGAMPAEAADKTITIKFASAAPGKTALGMAMKRLAKNVKERSKGHLVIQVFTDSQLGNERDIAEGVKMGSIQMSSNSSGSLAVFDSQLNIFSVPFIWKSPAHLMKVARGDIGQKIYDTFLKKTGIRIVDSGWIWGIRHLTTKGIPVKAPADLKGVKIRAPEIPIYVDMVKAWGATPVAVQSSDIFMALQTGLAQGQENPIPGIYFWRLYEVQDQLMLTAHMIQNNPVTINDNFFKSLSPADQKLLLEEVWAAGDWNNQEVERLQKSNLELLKKKGMKVITPDRNAFLEACKPLHEKYMSNWDREIYNAVMAAGSN